VSLSSKLNYYRRILSTYLRPGRSQLSFWHDTPVANPAALTGELGEYYMDFSQKADYAGPHDGAGIPLLDYRGTIGLQYNPIAIAQWGLGNFGWFCRTGHAERRDKFVRASDWLCEHLETNAHGVWVWNHYFDWEYRSTLRAPWYSGLAQGQGISLLLRTYKEVSDDRYLCAAEKAFGSFLQSDGGVAFTDGNGDVWFEEYIISPPTHILNGFIWALWGVYDYWLATGSALAKELFTAGIRTLKNNLDSYDLGFWSRYELTGTLLPMIASPFYHRLHIVQLRMMYRLTGEKVFSDYAERWERYEQNPFKRTRALCYKSAFKLCYY